MPITVRTLTDVAEIKNMSLRIAAGFGEAPRVEAEPLDAKYAAARINELTLCVEDDGRVLGGCFALALDLSLPGGAAISVAGLAGVGLDPSAVGRGAFRPMMAAHLQKSRDLGLAASALLASESGLYGRFGYGVASTVCRYEVETVFGALRADAPVVGEVRFAFDAEQTATDLAAVHDLVVTRSAMTSRPPAIWDIYFDEKQSWAGGGKRSFAVHYDDDGSPDGYVAYRIETNQVGHGVTESRAEVEEYVAANVGAELALWRYVMALPLVRRAVFHHMPSDAAATHFLLDPRQMVKTRQTDNVWLRPLDIERLLAERRYEQDGTFAFDFDDPQFPELCCRYRIRVTNGVGEVEQSGETSGVVMTPAQLGSLLTGEVRAVELARVGVLHGPADEIVAIDRAFTTSRVPFSLTRF